MFLFAADEQRDGVAGIVCGQAGGVRAAALSGGDQALRGKQRQRQPDGLPADLILPAQFGLRGQPVDTVIYIGGEHICQPGRQILVLCRHISFHPFCLFLLHFLYFFTDTAFLTFPASGFGQSHMRKLLQDRKRNFQCHQR